MEIHTARWRRWAIPLGTALLGLLGGAMFGGMSAGAQERRVQEDFSVQVTRIENPETRFFRTNIADAATGGQSADMFFYKVRDNKNSRILYFVYYQGRMLVPLYTTGE